MDEPIHIHSSYGFKMPRAPRISRDSTSPRRVVEVTFSSVSLPTGLVGSLLSCPLSWAKAIHKTVVVLSSCTERSSSFRLRILSKRILCRELFERYIFNGMLSQWVSGAVSSNILLLWRFILQRGSAVAVIDGDQGEAGLLEAPAISAVVVKLNGVLRT